MNFAPAVAVPSTPDVPSIMERMVRLQSEREAQDLALEELARRFENLEYQVSQNLLLIKSFQNQIFRQIWPKSADILDIS